MDVYRWIIFNTMVGNSDSHLKNISFLVDADGKRVAPFYDLLCTAVYHTRAYSDGDAVWPRERLSSPVVGAEFFEDVTYDKLIETGIELGLNKATATREVGKIVSRLGGAAEDIASKLEHHARPGVRTAPPPARLSAQKVGCGFYPHDCDCGHAQVCRLPAPASKEPQ